MPHLYWLLAYVALGHAGIHLATFPGTFFALVWLPSGIALAWLCRHGVGSLPWIWLASALVNVPYAWLKLDTVGFGSVLTVSILAPLIDGLQGWAAWRLARLDLSKPWEAWTLVRFLVSVAVAVTLTVALFVGLYVGAGFLVVPAGAELGDVLLDNWLMMTLADAQGMFLAVPLIAATAGGMAGRIPALLLAAGLSLVPLLLGRVEPVLVALLFPLAAWIVIRQRFAGAAVVLATAGLGVALMTAFGLSPLPLEAGVTAFSQWTLLIMALGTPLLLLGIVLDENRLYRDSLEHLVQERTQELQSALADTQWLATTDVLTGVMNRRHAEAYIERELARVERYPQPLVALGFDIDHFKRVNDVHGHKAGDVVLQDVCTAVQSVLRASDALARWGGEEFLVLLPHTELVDAQRAAEKVRAAIEQINFRLGWPLTISVGVAAYRKGEGRDAWLARADQALFDAKHRGRNCVVSAY